MRTRQQQSVIKEISNSLSVTFDKHSNKQRWIDGLEIEKKRSTLKDKLCVFDMSTCDRAWILSAASSTSHWMTTWFRKSGADWTNELRKAMASTRKRRDESVLLAASPPPPPSLLDPVNDSTRDAVELMIPLNSLSRTFYKKLHKMEKKKDKKVCCMSRCQYTPTRWLSFYSIWFTDSPIFKRNVVNASDTREWPPGILQRAVIN